MSQYTPTVAYPYCAKCGAPELTLPGQLAACARCCVAFYCSKECQQNDWVDHEITCNKLVASRSYDDDDISYFCLDDTLASSVGSPDIFDSPPPTIHEDETESRQDPEHLSYGALLRNNYSNSDAHEVSSITTNGLLTRPLSRPSSTFEIADHVFDGSDSEGVSTAPSSPELYRTTTPVNSLKGVKPMSEGGILGKRSPVDPFVNDDSLTAAYDESSVRRARVC